MKKWEYKIIAGQRHRKLGKKVQAMWLGVWCDVPEQMWFFHENAKTNDEDDR